MDNIFERIEENKILNSILSAIVTVLMAVVVYFFNIPNPNMILITGLIVFASLYGYAAGAVSGLVMITYSMFFFSENYSFIHFSPENLQKLLVIVIGVMVSVAFIGRLHLKNEQSAKELKELNQMLKKENLTLEAATIFESLTGVRSRYSLNKDYEKYFGKDVHVMILDIDDFKGINDTHGHALGDYVLKSIGRILNDIFGTEHSYRYGGDEFIVIYPDISEDDFIKLTDKLKKHVADIQYEGNDIGIHFSAGYVYGVTKENDDLQFMFRQADDCLYLARAKERISV